MIKVQQRDVCKRDLKASSIDIDDWELLATDRPAWRQQIRAGTKHAEHTRIDIEKEKRRQRKERKVYQDNIRSDFICKCGKDCHARIGLISHLKKCKL